MIKITSIFQEAMKQLTQLLPKDLQKELYELWEVSVYTGFLFIVIDFMWLVSVLVALDYLTCCV